VGQAFVANPAFDNSFGNSERLSNLNKVKKHAANFYFSPPARTIAANAARPINR
jgi:hypothetical protein